MFGPGKAKALFKSAMLDSDLCLAFQRFWPKRILNVENFQERIFKKGCQR
jgi:hypothetical protein